MAPISEEDDFHCQPVQTPLCSGVLSKYLSYGCHLFVYPSNHLGIVPLIAQQQPRPPCSHALPNAFSPWKRFASPLFPLFSKTNCGIIKFAISLEASENGYMKGSWCLFVGGYCSWGTGKGVRTRRMWMYPIGGIVRCHERPFMIHRHSAMRQLRGDKNAEILRAAAHLRPDRTRLAAKAQKTRQMRSVENYTTNVLGPEVDQTGKCISRNAPGE